MCVYQGIGMFGVDPAHDDTLFKIAQDNDLFHQVHRVYRSYCTLYIELPEARRN